MITKSAQSGKPTTQLEALARYLAATAAVNAAHIELVDAGTTACEKLSALRLHELRQATEAASRG